MDAAALLDSLHKKLDTKSELALAEKLGLTPQTLAKWRVGGSISEGQLANALIKARQSAVDDAHFSMVQPIAEFFEVQWCESTRNSSWLLFPVSGEESDKINKGLRNSLEAANGIYIFYDSRGRALYVGKAKTQSLWREMNLVCNRDRKNLQTIRRVDHLLNKDFAPAHEKPRLICHEQVALHDLVVYFSAYKVSGDMIDDVEALLIRGFANDLLNKKMEKFDHAR